ncbi:MAG: hypothetical protein K9M57_07350 [Phycisphaerae bacterium]|nr:hypothetical protein [Phycisphaerae bacterium]
MAEKEDLKVIAAAVVDMLSETRSTKLIFNMTNDIIFWHQASGKKRDKNIPDTINVATNMNTLDKMGTIFFFIDDIPNPEN